MGKTGRKPKSVLRATTLAILAESSPDAARWLALVSNGTYKKPSSVRVDVCKYIINQDIGQPTAKVAGKLDVNAIVKFTVGKGYEKQGGS